MNFLPKSTPIYDLDMSITLYNELKKKVDAKTLEDLHSLPSEWYLKKLSNRSHFELQKILRENKILCDNEIDNQILQQELIIRIAQKRIEEIKKFKV